MTTIGLSYTRGVFFYTPEQGIAHATYESGTIRTDFFPWGVRGMLFLFRRVLTTLPLYLYGLILTCLLLAVLPDLWAGWPFPPVPAYSLLVLALGYHFLFPPQMRMFHGAEHKVFSYRGSLHIRDLPDVRAASIINRGCSTNAVVLFFTVFLLTIPFVNGWIASVLGVLALFLVPNCWKWGNRKIIFPISAWLQQHLTTTEPQELHLKVAILSYLSLQAGRALSEEEAWGESSY